MHEQNAAHKVKVRGIVLLVGVCLLASFATLASKPSAAQAECFLVPTADLADSVIEALYDQGFWYSYAQDPEAPPDAISSTACEPF